MFLPEGHKKILAKGQKRLGQRPKWAVPSSSQIQQHFCENFVVFWENTVIFWANTVVFRTKTVVFRTNTVVFKENTMMFRASTVVFRATKMIFCFFTNSFFLLENTVVF
jgi:hypothetical protein